MSNPRLTSEQRAKLFTPLFLETKKKLDRLSKGDPDVLFALRRKLSKELMYLERGTPALRNKLKAFKRNQQKGLCADCRKPLPKSHTELDRKEAREGYTAKNTRLVHHKCHIISQRKKGYA